MTRRIIWAKDDYFDHGDIRIDMDPSVVKLPEDSIPIVIGFNWADLPVGNITDLRLEDGEITGEVFWADKDQKNHCETLVESGDMFFGGYYNHVVQTTGKNVKKRVLSCELLAAGLVAGNGIGGVRKVYSGANPGATL